MVQAYATKGEYETFAGGDSPADIGRLLSRASELIDDLALQPFTVDANGIPTDTDVAGAMRDAACAQVEYWVKVVGEEHDLEGLAGSEVSILSLSLTLPPEVAPRALRCLNVGGLMNVAHEDLTSVFFSSGTS